MGLRADIAGRSIPQFQYLSLYDEWAELICRSVEIRDKICVDIGCGKGTCAVISERDARRLLFLA